MADIYANYFVVESPGRPHFAREKQTAYFITAPDSDAREYAVENFISLALGQIALGEPIDTEGMQMIYYLATENRIPLDHEKRFEALLREPERYARARFLHHLVRAAMNRGSREPIVTEGIEVDRFAKNMRREMILLNVNGFVAEIGQQALKPIVYTADSIASGKPTRSRLARQRSEPTAETDEYLIRYPVTFKKVAGEDRMVPSVRPGHIERRVGNTFEVVASDLPFDHLPRPATDPQATPPDDTTDSV